MGNIAENKPEVTAIWEELGISNDFLFGKVMQDPELCKELLQRILPDLQMIDKGQMYKQLKPCYVIFISPVDVFGKGEAYLHI